MDQIAYRYGNSLAIDQVIELYRAPTLGERHPFDNRATMEKIIQHVNLVVMASWDGEQPIGIARTLTDFDYAGYLADLAVSASHQRRGIGIQLLRQTRARMGPISVLVLLAAPKAVGYYPNIGFPQHGSAWSLHTTEPPSRSRLRRRFYRDALTIQRFSLRCREFIGR